MKLGSVHILQPSNLTQSIPCSDMMKFKGECAKQCPGGNQEHFTNYSLPNNKSRPGKENPTGTSRFTFSIYIGVAPPVMFLIQDFMVTHLSDGNSEQGISSLCILRVPSVIVKQQSHLNSLIKKKLSVKPMNFRKPLLR